MSYTDFARRAFPVTTLVAAACAVWAVCATHPDVTALLPAPAPTTTIITQLVTQAIGTPPGTPTVPGALIAAEPSAPTPTPALDSGITVTPGPGPDSTNRTPPQEKAWLSAFDRAMDQEFTRLEAREKQSTDPVELAVVAQLKQKLMTLDELWIRADALTSVEEKMKLQLEAQQTMGEIIQLGRADRNQRLTSLARSFGVEKSEDLRRFVDEVDRAFVETHLDWASLFNRGATTPTEENRR